MTRGVEKDHEEAPMREVTKACWDDHESASCLLEFYSYWAPTDGETLLVYKGAFASYNIRHYESSPQEGVQKTPKGLETPYHAPYCLQDDSQTTCWASQSAQQAIDQPTVDGIHSWLVYTQIYFLGMDDSRLGYQAPYPNSIFQVGFWERVWQGQTLKLMGYVGTGGPWGTFLRLV